ncbi:hypothetical protein MRX96_011346 [Rhipicephalus microplus]
MDVGKIGEYHLRMDASLDEYIERPETFFVGNKITTDEQKRAVLLSCSGQAAYRLVVTMLKPIRPTMVSYDEIKKAVRKHLHLSLFAWHARFLFYRRN